MIHACLCTNTPNPNTAETNSKPDKCRGVVNIDISEITRSPRLTEGGGVRMGMVGLFQVS